MSYIRKKTYSIAAVLDRVVIYDGKPKKDRSTDYDGDLMDMTSMRYQVFKAKGVTCAGCGLTASFFAKERDPKQTHEEGHPPSWHFNLYGLEKDGSEVLFTKDHIIPKSRGGHSRLENLQPMCEPCNLRKSNHVTNDHTPPPR